MKKAARRSVIPGCASVVLKHGKVIQASAFGKADLEANRSFRLDTICRVFCLTKSFATRMHEVAFADSHFSEAFFLSMEPDRLPAVFVR